jgi:putative selenium metabolism protein SsnA
MMTTLITHGAVVTRDEAQPFIEDGAVAYEGQTILAVGTTADLTQKYPNAEVIDARGRLVMPGFINTHMHYYSTFARGANFGSKPPTTFGEILTGLWWKLDKMLNLDDVYYSAVGPMIDAVRMGVTSVIDHHASPMAVRGSLFKIAEAAKLMGLRSNLCYEISDRDGEAIAKEGIAENIEFAKHCQAKGDDLLGGLVGMHAQITVSQKTMDALTSEAESIGAGYHIHAAEGIEDVVDSLAKYDRRVIERLSDNGILNERSLVIHCVNVLPGEIELLAESGVAVVNNPESNMSNAVGCSPVLDMMAAGVLVGMGTDGYCVDMTQSLRGVHAIQKHNAKLPCVAWGEPHTMLFDNNRAIMNRHIKGEVGTLKPGAYADIIVVGYEAPTPINAETIDGHILFGISGRNVDTTIINGRIVMRERELQGIDEQKIMADSRQQAQKLWSRI